MSDYLSRLAASIPPVSPGKTTAAWSIKALDVSAYPAPGSAPGLAGSAALQGIAGVRDLPRGRYVHLAGAQARLVLRDSRDPTPALEEANIPLQQWDYLSPTRIRFAFAGQFPLELTLRASSACEVRVGRERYKSQPAAAGLQTFKLPLNTSE